MDRFWGGVLAANGTLKLNVPKGHVLRITQVATPDTTGTIAVLANVAGAAVVIAHLRPADGVFHASTDIIFSPDQDAVLTAKGTASAHVTGYLQSMGDEEDFAAASDAEEEDAAPKAQAAKKEAPKAAKAAAAEEEESDDMEDEEDLDDLLGGDMDEEDLEGMMGEEDEEGMDMSDEESDEEPPAPVPAKGGRGGAAAAGRGGAAPQRGRAFGGRGGR